jgi:hypothetical protein
MSRDGFIGGNQRLSRSDMFLNSYHFVSRPIAWQAMESMRGQAVERCGSKNKKPRKEGRPAIKPLMNADEH